MALVRGSRMADAAASKDRIERGCGWVRLEFILDMAVAVLRGLMMCGACPSESIPEWRIPLLAASSRDGQQPRYTIDCHDGRLRVAIRVNQYKSGCEASFLRLDSHSHWPCWVLVGALRVAGSPPTSLPKRVTLPTSPLFNLPDQPPTHAA